MDVNKITLLYSIPALAAFSSLLPKNKNVIGLVQTFWMVCLFILGLFIINDILDSGSIGTFKDFIYLDALSGLMIFLITLVSTIVSIYSIGYMTNEVEEKIHNIWKLKGYYFLLNAFVFSMLLTVTANSIGVLWIAIELTTLVSAFLVGYYNKEAPVEAAWKYIILCTVGIAFAMIGIVLAYYGVTHAGGVKSVGLNWNYLITISHKLDPDLMKVAFIFILIGLGTKAGLAPMHTWLPDAHSEAPTPVSALLSGVLIKCGIYGIIRFAIITNLSVGNGFTNKLILVFGLLSIGISVPFILVQRHIKRLLAYHSLEHIGIITCGIGFANPLAIFGALFHMINHAMVKSLMFFTSGNLALKFHTKDMEHIKGVIQVMPISGIVLLVGGLALAGSPPFSIFISEFYILSGGIEGNHWVGSILFLLFLIIVFGGLSHHLLQMAIGPTNSTTESNIALTRSEINKSSVASLVLPLVLVCILGIWIPGPLLRLLNEATRIVTIGHTI
ncbi:MAG: hydrogenase 4 subunit F [Candidatus Melainabacteria bacterium]|nr:hydrogenase 4 subunit F [Candidatus Melainabacteria bacterium]